MKPPAGKDFVDALLSFLTLPLGTIARLVAEESNINKVSVGSLSSLYESLANLEVKHFLTEACKEMLIQPRNSMEAHCRKVKLNIDDTQKIKYFICENWECSRKESGGLLSTFSNTRCKCGKLMNRGISLQNGSEVNNEGFIPDVATFIIYDDLKMVPDNFETTNITKKEIIDLLKCSLLSETPLTDLFVRKKEFSMNSNLMSGLNFDIGEPETNVGWKMMKVKVVVRKSNKKILFALANEDFVDFIFSFLTFPLGRVVQMLKGKSCIGSIDNLYKSLHDLNKKYFRSPDLKDKLVNYQLAHQYKLQKQILPIDEVPTSNYSCFSQHHTKDNSTKGYLTVAQAYKRTVYSGNFQDAGTYIYAPLRFLEPQSLSGIEYSSNWGGRGFVKKPSLYMVTEDLAVTPSSSISVVSYLTMSNVSPSDLEEKIINIGMKEGLSILKASLVSSSALTDGLSQFLKPKIKEEENIDN
ncbi:hypothetical protein RIF29_30395 [Crotalaria pallida]|uniref:DUF674 family protein n=1 Tax=Crotalaria pallida TaxID=3830 RepID=A0AAN9HY83_CROPI